MLHIPLLHKTTWLKLYLSLSWHCTVDLFVHTGAGPECPKAMQFLPDVKVNGRKDPLGAKMQPAILCNHTHTELAATVANPKID